MRTRVLHPLGLILILAFWVVYLARGWTALAAHPWQLQWSLLLGAMVAQSLAWLCLGLAW